MEKVAGEERTPEILKTYAQALFLSEDADRAVEIGRQVLGLCPDPSATRADVEKDLEENGVAEDGR